MKRIAFIPTVKSKKYFDALIERLTEESELGVRVTMREAFDYMVERAIEREQIKVIPDRFLRSQGG